jgi:hypothetical protein
MRSVFDQYEQPENKPTHALVCSLESDRGLIRPFLKWIGVHGVPPTEEIEIVEQQLPGESESGEEGRSSSLPDASFFANDNWAVVVESKVQAGANYDQLKRHKHNARGFEKSKVVLISVDRQAHPPKGVVAIEWREVYAWFKQQKSHSEWSRRFVEYMEVFESKMIEQDYQIRGTITMFGGIHFDEEHPYNYRDAKRLIKLLGSELKKRKDLRRLGVGPTGEGRGAITGTGGDAVWDYLPLRVARRAGAFTEFPHFTLSLNREYASAAITVPHGVKGGFKRRLTRKGRDDFRTLIVDIEKRLNRSVLPKDAKPFIYALQRHYPSRRSHAEKDAGLDADIRTLTRTSNSQVKYQPQWIDAIYEVVCHKKSKSVFENWSWGVKAPCVGRC